MPSASSSAYSSGLANPRGRRRRGRGRVHQGQVRPLAPRIPGHGRDPAPLSVHFEILCGLPVGDVCVESGELVALYRREHVDEILAQKTIYSLVGLKCIKGSIEGLGEL